MSRMVALLGPKVRWALWALALVGWTALLLRPEPAQVAGEVLPEQAVFPVAKLGHVGAYAVLTLLTAWLPVRVPGRFWLLALVILHAPGTEWLQQFVEGRTGTVRDAVLDWVGIAVGVALTWRRWRPAP